MLPFVYLAHLSLPGQHESRQNEVYFMQEELGTPLSLTWGLKYYAPGYQCRCLFTTP